MPGPCSFILDNQCLTFELNSSPPGLSDDIYSQASLMPKLLSICNFVDRLPFRSQVIASIYHAWRAIWSQIVGIASHIRFAHCTHFQRSITRTSRPSSSQPEPVSLLGLSYGLSKSHFLCLQLSPDYESQVYLYSRIFLVTHVTFQYLVFLNFSQNLIILYFATYYDCPMLI